MAASEIVLCVCPSYAAEDVAAAVATHGFDGTYVDANAISPQRMLRIAERRPPRCSVLDGAIIGPPPGQGRTARLYLSGAPHVAGLIGELFENTDVDKTEKLPDSPELVAGLCKLLEAKDCFVRAALDATGS
ncbi:hypothetical protein ACFYWY_35685 [Streptomyces sp. NPDC002870]|uniref:hypothetical protein n=1 Tax=Streptomyces sp. NPDC002870 TaxID=3364666 RepID=UPI003678F7BC